MKLITKPSELNSEFIRLLDNYPQYFFATAWAGLPVEVSNKLFANKDRIKQMVVGIHFYQTAPEFFYRFKNINTIRAILQPSGTFHLKAFLFFESDVKWTLLIGSANFTRAAFSVNTEATIMIDSTEGEKRILLDTKKLINTNWEFGKRIDNDFSKTYKLLWAKMHKKRRDLELSEGADEIFITGVSEFMTMSWEDYVKEYSSRKKMVKKRFEMLETIRGIFATGRSLIEMTEDERRFIGGNPNNLNLPGAENYGEFGTSGNGQFMNKMIDGNIIISNALDKIPLVGTVTEDNYNEFVQIFLQEPDITDGWVSSAGRLLALKRPDVFYNITKANRVKFCENFNNTKSHTKFLRNYWQLVISKIHLSVWYNEIEANNDFERQLRETRVAMLDVLFYE